MQYVRTFNLQSAHLNSAKSYAIVWDAAAQSAGTLRSPSGLVSAADLLSAMLDCHGHNFKIVVDLAGDKVDGIPWLVDDVKLTAVVMEWDNLNLSVHPDFLSMKMRATTENMAQVLLDKLHDHFGEIVDGIRVTVYETAEIYAVAE